MKILSLMTAVTLVPAAVHSQSTPVHGTLVVDGIGISFHATWTPDASTSAPGTVPVTTPVVTPVSTPVTTPVKTPVATTPVVTSPVTTTPVVTAPVTTPILTPISTPILTPVSTPVTKPVSVDPVITVPVVTTPGVPFPPTTIVTDTGLPDPPVPPSILMTAAHPLNQPATQYPQETRSLLSSAVGDLTYISRPIDDTWHKIFGPNHIHFSVSMPWVSVDSGKTPSIFSDMTINYPSWISDDGATCAAMPASATKTTHWPVLAASIEPGDAGSDGHTIVLDTRTNLLYESQYTRSTLDATGKATFTADATRCWHIAQPEIGTPGQNSANAAGLPILPFILRYDEAASGNIKHAIGVTFALSRSGPNGPYFVSPASHGAGDNWSTMTWPGQRMYLRPDYPTTGLSAINLAIVQAWKKYGLVNNDNGITGVVTTDLDKRWDGNDLQKMGDAMTLNDFILVNSGPIVDADGAQPK